MGDVQVAYCLRSILSALGKSVIKSLKNFELCSEAHAQQYSGLWSTGPSRIKCHNPLVSVRAKSNHGGIDRISLRCC